MAIYGEIGDAQCLQNERRRASLKSPQNWHRAIEGIVAVNNSYEALSFPQYFF